MFLQFLEALLYEEGQVDQGAVRRPLDLVVSVENIGSEVVQGLFHNVFPSCEDNGRGDSNTKSRVSSKTIPERQLDSYYYLGPSETWWVAMIVLFPGAALRSKTAKK